MEYVRQTIQLRCADDVVVPIEAMAGVGTGLAYHPVVSRPELYALTHIQSGYAITGLTMLTEAEIQAFLVNVAELDPDRWQIDLPTLKRRVNTYKRLQVQIELAHYNACSPYTIFMYAEGTDGDLLPESFDAVEDPQASSNLALATEIFFYRDQSDKIDRVRLVRMDGRTGKHETLHVYTRNDLLPRDMFSLIGHLFNLALVALGIDADQVIGESTLEIDSTVVCGLCTVDVNDHHVCLWDFEKNGIWEVYSVTPLADAPTVAEQEQD